MATHDRREDTPVKDSLVGHPAQYNFYQAVRLLAPAPNRDQKVVDELDRAIKFETESGDQFSGSDIYDIKAGADQVSMTLATFGLTGPLGPMPQQHSARIESEARQGNTALKRFLGLFEHRFISLLYLVKKKFRIGLHSGIRSDSDQYRYLVNLSGLPQVPGKRETLRHAPLLPFAGLLAGGKISPAALVNILSALLDTEVRVSLLKGAFVNLEPSLQARLASASGMSTQSNRQYRLGEKISVGGRIWNQSHGIELELGPVHWDTANDWMPGTEAYAKLVDLLLYTTNGQWQLETKIKVREDSIPVSRLNRSKRLGYNTWLKTVEGEDAVRYTRRAIKPSHFH